MQEENYVSVFCDKKRSYIVTSFGRVFAMGASRLNKMSNDQKKAMPGFVDYTKNLTMDGRFSIVKITAGNDDQLGIIFRNKDIQAGQEKVKMSMGSSVLKDIIFSTRFDSEDFVVGYMDRFYGILEISAAAFNSSEIPKHRIRYFKKNGQIVWDRRTRLDLMK